MEYRETNARLVAYRSEIGAIRRKMRELQASVEPEPVRDYEFTAARGTTKLSELFGNKTDLILIHNMGVSCRYCTVWADAYNGVYKQLASRAAFAVTGPDAPETQREVAERRGWRFPFLSHRGTSFARDMGFTGERGEMLPGVSVFQRRDGALVRVSQAEARPFDDFNGLYHFFDLLPEGPGDWVPVL